MVTTATPLKKIPVDTAQLLTPLLMGVGEIKTSREGEIKTDYATGLPLYLYLVAVRVDGTRAAAVLTVQTPGEQLGIVEGSRVVLVGLMASPWEMADGSGVTFSATAILPADSATSSTTAPAATASTSAVTTGTSTSGPVRAKGGDA